MKLDHAREALQWSKEKIDEADIILSAIFSRQDYLTVIERNRELGGYDIKIKLRNGIPRSVNRTIGEAIQYARSALDYAIHDIAHRMIGRETRVGFPIVDRAEDFERHLKKVKILSISQDLADFCRSEKPYQGGNDALFLLNKLNNSGKHREPVVFGTAQTNFYGREIRFDGPILNLTIPPSGDPIDGIVLATVADPNPNFEYNGQIGIAVSFANVSELRNRHMITVLREQHAAVQSVIARMESRF